MGGQLVIHGGTINLPSGVVTNTDVASDADVGEDKLRHMYKCGSTFDLAIGATPVAREEIVFVADTVCTVRGFHCLLNDTGTSTDVDFDLKKNGTTILSAVVNITHSAADRAVQNGTISGATLAAGDVISISLAVTSSTGAQGPFAWANIAEHGAGS